MVTIDISAALSIGSESAVWNADLSLPGTALGALDNAAGTVAVGEAVMEGIVCGYRASYPDACASPCIPSLRIEDNTRHNGGTNLGFCDGHAKWHRAGVIAAHCYSLWHGHKNAAGLDHVEDIGNWTP